MSEQKLSAGQKAPDFSLPNQDGKAVSLKDFNGKWVVLYSYPKDNTPGCTIEAIDFTKYSNDFKQLGAIVLGISPDDGKSHCNFIEKQKLSLTLLSDLEHKTLAQYGAWGMKRMFLKKYEGVIRSTFLIDPNGKLAHIWHKVSVKDHAKEVLSKLKELQR